MGGRRRRNGQEDYARGGKMTRKEISENKFQNGESVCLDGKMEDAR